MGGKGRRGERGERGEEREGGTRGRRDKEVTKVESHKRIAKPFIMQGGGWEM